MPKDESGPSFLPLDPSKRASKTRLMRGWACLNCRSRRIRCSGTTPTCHQCTYLQHECLYGTGKRNNRVKQLEDKVSQIEDLLRSTGPSTTANTNINTSTDGPGPGADAGARVTGPPVRGTSTPPPPPLPHHGSSDASSYSIRNEGETQPRPSGSGSIFNLSLPIAHMTAVESANTNKLEAFPTSSKSWRGDSSFDSSIFEGSTFGMTASGPETGHSAVQHLGSGPVHRADVRLLDAQSRVHAPCQHLTVVDSVNTDFPEGFLTPSKSWEGDMSFNSLTFAGSKFGAVAPGAGTGMVQSNNSGQVPSLEQIFDFSTLDLRFMDPADSFHAASTVAPHPPLEQTQLHQQHQQQRRQQQRPPISVDKPNALGFLSQATSSFSEQQLHATRFETHSLTYPNSTSPAPAATLASPKINPSPLIAALPHPPFSTVRSHPSNSTTGSFFFDNTPVSTSVPYQAYVIDVPESNPFQLRPQVSTSTSSSSQVSPSVQDIDAKILRPSSPAESSSAQATLHLSSTLDRKRCASSLESEVEHSHDEQEPEMPEGVERDGLIWGMQVEDYKALSARERRRIRNRISARDFRAKRKEHVSSLESTLDAKNLEIKFANDETFLLRTEVAELKQRLAKYEKHYDRPIA